ncbi:double-strand break repair protein AddB [Sinisalibacter aestuarii]|uniref:Double-strand break repair protein AddB n=1 Tax=Sinisalibacter aestuarii TaxID=2949426 RepID=A0ABQ5LNE9_9RHOB|nr:double-strand break repair protein AddB [Sinisalibacter aestuarii]GKY86483.1 double-strand break repair protein AddB [Sinisalibacter aestuarii]
MFEHDDRPRLFALPPGVDFPRAVAEGLRARFAGQPPEALARVSLFVNTRRMQRRLSELFDEGPALLLPRIRLVTDLGQDAAFADLPPAVSPLRRRLELASLVARLLDAQPDLAPRAAIYDLADSLAALMDEMQGEGVSPEAIRALDVSDISGHWQRSLTFLGAVEAFFGEASEEPPDLEARQRRVIERLVAGWERDPPKDPVIVAGSTGSRGATQMLMRAVARLPQGAVILPGFDFDMPAPVWAALDDALAAEDHPQFRFARLMQALEIGPDRVRRWSDHPPPNPRRNALVSLALRPAPVTDQWQVEGPGFAGIDTASDGMTLVEAPSPRAEASAIALILRHAAETGTEAALISPDRTLTRQVTAALDRWRIEPDDSAGRPLPLTAPGRFLRHIAEMTGTTITGPALVALLKHPLTSTGGGARNDHLRLSRDLELEALRDSMPYPTRAALLRWAGEKGERLAWVAWLSDVLDELARAGTRPLADHVAQTLALAERIAAGPGGEGAGGLWDKPAGREAKRITDELQREAPHGGSFSQADYRDLFASVLNKGEVRNPVQPHPGIRIWGTLEARVQGVELVILGGLNEGTWPETPPPDPWMNRKMRHDAGLLLPERRIGLSAHDFQQAIGAGRVVLTRAIRDAESQTVPSRWINRLVNLMSGMSAEGEAALAAMRDRGRDWLDKAALLDEAVPVPPAPRPSPRPPVEARPRQLSVTRVTTLVRDPYAVYADKVLRLRPLRPLHQSPDAPLRGTILHRVMERFVKETPAGEAPKDGHARLMTTAEEVLEADAPWPAARVLWLARLARVADQFLAGEAERRSRATPVEYEIRGRLEFDTLGFALTGTADRIDRDEAGALYIYDYKTGHIPTEAEREHIDKQLYLEAVMARAGAFDKLAAGRVAEVAYIGLGAMPKFERISIGDEDIFATRDELVALIGKYMHRAQGYTARRLAETQRFAGDYDHLSRYGEWDHSTPATPEEVGG